MTRWVEASWVQAHVIMTHLDTERLRLHRGPQEGADQGEGAAGEEERGEMSEEISKRYC